jgi:sugar O-acyltransferase (sialic acid O-acetyltransferase NeuD family)
MLVAIGANGLAKQVYPHLEGSGFDIFFLDDTPNASENLYEYRVIHDFEFLNKQIENGVDLFFTICIGNPKWRKHFFEKLINMNATPVSIISPSASISEKTKIGDGNLILNFSLIETDAVIGNGNLINCYAGIFHDVVIGDYNEIMPGSKILGSAKIGNECRIGSNSCILPGVTVCDGVTIGAGAVVNKNITQPGTYVGVPAKLLR